MKKEILNKQQINENKEKLILENFNRIMNKLDSNYLIDEASLSHNISGLIKGNKSMYFKYKDKIFVGTDWYNPNTMRTYIKSELYNGIINFTNKAEFSKDEITSEISFYNDFITQPKNEVLIYVAKQLISLFKTKLNKLR